MQKKKIVILVGHPDVEPTLSSHLVQVYAKAALGAGHEVKQFHLAQMHFDPILHRGYKVMQELEPDLKNFQEALKWADHFVLIYPNWWCTMPALLKGFFDRVWLPGFAFHMNKKPGAAHATGWHKLLKGRTARVIVVSGTRPILIYLLFGDYTNEIKRGILGFAGFRTRLTCLGAAENITEAQKSRWTKKMEQFGRSGK